MTATTIYGQGTQADGWIGSAGPGGIYKIEPDGKVYPFIYSDSNPATSPLNG